MHPSSSQNSESTQVPFHLAFPVSDLDEARAFYGELLGCPEGRSSEDWIDFDLWGHQIVAHRVKDFPVMSETSAVDDHQVPVRHFGLVLTYERWRALADHLEAQDTPFLIRPCLRFEGTPGAQHTFFVQDPSGNALEFKSMVHPEALFTPFNPHAG